MSREGALWIGGVRLAIVFLVLFVISELFSLSLT